MVRVVPHLGNETTKMSSSLTFEKREVQRRKVVENNSLEIV